MSNTTWLLADQVFSRVLALAVNILLSRYLGANDFGLYSYAISLVALFALFSNLGIDDLVIRDIVSKSNSEKIILGTAFVMKFFGSLCTFLLVILTAVFLTNDSQTFFLVAILAGACFFSCFSVVGLSLQAHVRAKFLVLANTLSSLAYLVLFLSLLYEGENLYLIASLSVFQAVFLGLALLSVYRLVGGKVLLWRFNYALALSLFKQAWPLILSMGLVSVYMSSDKILIKHFLGNVPTGEYSIASKLSEASYFIPTAILASVMPAVVKIRDNEEHYYSRLQSIFNLMVLLAIIVAVPTTIFSEQIVKLLFGEQYINSAHILSIHVWVGVLVYLGTASGKWMVIEGLSKLYFYRSLIGVVINVVAGVVLIGQFGVVGAAYATMIAQFFVVIVFDFFNQVTRKCFFMKLKAFSPMQWVSLSCLFLGAVRKER